MRTVPPAINHIDFGTHESWILCLLKILTIILWCEKYLKYQPIPWEWEWVLYGGALRNALRLTSSLHVAPSPPFTTQGRQTHTLLFFFLWSFSYHPLKTPSFKSFISSYYTIQNNSKNVFQICFLFSFLHIQTTYFFSLNSFYHFSF